jgi:hypothetical protein
LAARTVAWFAPLPPPNAHPQVQTGQHLRHASWISDGGHGSDVGHGSPTSPTEVTCRGQSCARPHTPTSSTLIFHPKSLARSRSKSLPCRPICCVNFSPQRARGAGEGRGPCQLRDMTTPQAHMKLAREKVRASSTSFHRATSGATSRWYRRMMSICAVFDQYLSLLRQGPCQALLSLLPRFSLSILPYPVPVPHALSCPRSSRAQSFAPARSSMPNGLRDLEHPWMDLQLYLRPEIIR